MDSGNWGRGRGRGYGRGTNGLPTKTPWKPSPTLTKSEGVVKPGNRMIDMAEQYGDLLNNYESSSSEDELHDDEILDKTIKKYNDALDDKDIDQSYQTLHEVLQSGTNCCLVCIESIKRINAIWNCSSCFCSFHLQCIQKWAREGVGRQSIQTEGDLTGIEFSWNCPKCRFEYKQNECPTKYFCFCNKEENPPFDPWTVPHSCGNRCEKPLRPQCGHDCLLLCHPGACPPCPKTIRSTCYCGKSKPVLKRCSKKEWSCGNICNRALQCGHHTCQELCHSGKCPPCPNTSSRPCMCGKLTSMKKCAEQEWSCEQTCGKTLSCGHHTCEKECHSEECGNCPRSGKRLCPCGKTESMLPCTEDIYPCQDTCMKRLACHLHKCFKRCHYGPCDTCLQVTEKTCRCGRKTKEIPCSQTLTCESKCGKLKNCGRHPCKKKCCNGSCPPCEQICNRTLNCRNHKCPSPCHTGSCYPCPLTRKVSCFCGANSITTPCGKEKSVKPPKCRNNCSKSSDCHHETRTAHRCHYGMCPPCQLVCDQKLPDCQHTCPDVCHDKVRDKVAENHNLLRGLNSKKKGSHNFVFVALPCRPCQQHVGKLCLGGHSIKDFVCSEMKDLKGYSCTEPCGRMLNCENHLCTKKCHTVKGKPESGKAGSNCSSCHEYCLKARPEGCIHDCKLPCHPGPCPECEIHLKLSCHCKSIQLAIKCSEYNAVDDNVKAELLCCKSRCPRLMDCGHLCPKLCHQGSCADVSECTDKKRIRCKCGRRKKDFPCIEVMNGVVSLDCDDRCTEIRDKKTKEKQEQEQLEKETLFRQQQDELERFERKKQGRKRKQRQSSGENDKEPSFIHKHKTSVSFFIFIIIIFLIFVTKIIFFDN